MAVIGVFGSTDELRLTEELREIMANLGVRRIEELIGRTDFLEVDTKMALSKAKRML